MRSDLYEHLPIVAQNLACTYAGWRRARSRFGGHFQRALRSWERSAHSPVPALRALQRRRLETLVTQARAHVPYYRRLDLPPPSSHPDPEEAIRRILGAMPTLDKTAYREDPGAFLAEDVPRSRLRRGKTSGTTGTALRLWYTPESLAEEYATVWRLRRACGAQLDDPFLTFGGQIVVPFRQQEPPFWRTSYYGPQTLFSLYHMAPENLRRYVDAVHEAPARYAVGYPSSLALVGRAMLEAGRPMPPGALVAVFPSSETLLSFQREVIQKAFGAPVRDRYGSSEFCVSMTECETGRLHVDMEFCIVEVETTEETAEYERGPLLVTGLAPGATPFLRYRIGDVGLRSKKPCSCGRPGDVFLRVEGRIDDYVVTPDGRLVGRLDHVFKEQHDVAEAQILQESKEAIEVLIVPLPGYDRSSERNLVREIRARLGDEIGITIHHVEEIPREPNAKFRAVKSRVGRIAVRGAGEREEAR